MDKGIAFLMNQQGVVFEIAIDTNPLAMDWQLKSIASGAVDVTAGMDTTINITSNPGSFFTMSTDGTNYGTSQIYETGDFTLYVKAAADNDATPNSGSITISDDDNNANDLIVDVSQIAKPA